MTHRLQGFDGAMATNTVTLKARTFAITPPCLFLHDEPRGTVLDYRFPKNLLIKPSRGDTRCEPQRSCLQAPEK